MSDIIDKLKGPALTYDIDCGSEKQAAHVMRVLNLWPLALEVMDQLPTDCYGLLELVEAIDAFMAAAEREVRVE